MRDLRVSDRQSLELSQRRASAVLCAEELADTWFERGGHPDAGPPLEELKALHRHDLLMAPLPVDLGGLGLGTERGTHILLLRLLAALGGADLALGRIYEGHVNALLLLQAYGSAEQILAGAEAARRGLLFGVWNTGEPKLMRIAEVGDALVLEGCKTFATGAGFVQRPIVTAERNGWQMTMPRMDAPEIVSAVRIDGASWQPLGMESSQSFTIDFTGVRLNSSELLGKPGDFYRDPLFRGGAIRFAAVQSGALVRLAQAFADSLTARGRQSDPYQIARLGEVQLLAQQAVLWIERAAATAETSMHVEADEQTARHMVHFANMTRLGVERAATAMMEHIAVGVGARGLLRPARFERILRDLTMYLRQPNPDGTLADVGRSALLEANRGYWAELSGEGALGTDSADN